MMTHVARRNWIRWRFYLTGIAFDLLVIGVIGAVVFALSGCDRGEPVRLKTQAEIDAAKPSVPAEIGSGTYNFNLGTAQQALDAPVGSCLGYDLQGNAEWSAKHCTTAATLNVGHCVAFDGGNVVDAGASCRASP